MNRILTIGIIIFSLLVLSLNSGKSSNNGMNFYKQSDLQCITHPDLFNKWSCQIRGSDEVASEPVVIESKTGNLPQRIYDRPICRFLSMKTVYFDYDKSLLKPEGKAAIHRNVEFLNARPNARILIEGNCDERGTNEYNLALGERRAQAVKKYMISLGIDESRITTKSWGEERPVALGHNESSWWQNRRGDMFFSE